MSFAGSDVSFNTANLGGAVFAAGGATVASLSSRWRRNEAMSCGAIAATVRLLVGRWCGAACRWPMTGAAYATGYTGSSCRAGERYQLHS